MNEAPRQDVDDVDDDDTDDMDDALGPPGVHRGAGAGGAADIDAEGARNAADAENAADAGERVPESDVPSKSRRKRDADAVRELGRRLAALGASERATIPLDEDVRAAIDELNRIVRHGARKRQLGFLAKRLRRLDLVPIEAALARLERSARVSVERHHRIEGWRERLLGLSIDESPAEALTAFLDAHPHADRQRLRQLQRRALAERDVGRSPAAARELFRLVRDTMTHGAPGD